MIIIRDSTARTQTPEDPAFSSKGIVALFAVLVTLTCIAASAIAQGQTSASVLCYHAFLDKKKKDLFCFSLDELNSHIERFRSEGFRFVSVADILSGRIRGSRNILITVDDGNRSVYDAYWKVFKPNNIRPLLAIYPHIIGKKRYALTWDQLRELADSGCDIAAHGYFHLKINQRLFEENPQYFNMEIYDSKKILEQQLNRKIDVFVYPFGLSTDIAIQALKHAGYRYAFTIDKGKIDTPLVHDNGRFGLPRYMITRSGWEYCFNRIIRNAQGAASLKVARTNENSNGKPSILHDERRDSAARKSLVHKRHRREKQGEPDSIIDDKPIRRIPTSFKRLPPPIPITVGRVSSKPLQNFAMEVALIDTRRDSTASPLKQADFDKTLHAKAEKAMTGYYALIKKKHNQLAHESYATYRNFLRLVRGKIDRIKDQIKRYVVRNF
ncbi:MAG: hypothetical protein A2W19_09925 [Spirochaetes bacterium RBG_16_49_21]|nr:MAG: hypothetical protein A2W19_09925 [Spirochaetes bacterium RBG_16_49_21]